MRDIIAYCCRSWAVSSFLTVGVRPKTSPPLDAQTLDPTVLVARIIYIRLHGITGQPYLYGDNYITALTAEQVRKLDLSGSLVFLEGCHSDTMAQAFLDAKAQSVTGCTETTYGKLWLLGPSSVVGRHWLQAIKAGKSAQEALQSGISHVPAKYAKGWYTVGKELI